jgi:hypothetical protein
MEEFVIGMASSAFPTISSRVPGIERTRVTEELERFCKCRRTYDQCRGQENMKTFSGTTGYARVYVNGVAANMKNKDHKEIVTSVTNDVARRMKFLK